MPIPPNGPSMFKPGAFQAPPSPDELALHVCSCGGTEFEPKTIAIVHRFRLEPGKFNVTKMEILSCTSCHRRIGPPPVESKE